MKKILSLILVASLLLSAVVMLTSCKPKGPENNGDTVELDLSEYVVTYGKELTRGGKDAASLLAAQLKYLTGTGLRAWMDQEDEEVSNDEYEILIGETNRTETFRALNRIEGSGWIITVIGKKLVIVGTNAFLTRVAMTYFTDNFVQQSAVNGTVLTVKKEIITSELKTVVLENASGEASFEIVYDDRIDDYDNGGKSVYDYAKDTNPTTGGPDADYTYKASLQIRETLAGLINIAPESIPMHDDSTVATTQEVLVGNVDGRAACVKEMATLGGNEYGVAIRDGKIMLLAWNDVTLPKTFAVLEDILSGCRSTSEAGKSRYVVPVDCVVKEVYECAWATAFPKPEGENIVLRAVQDISNDSLEYIYIGEGADSNAFTAYCRKLESAGYRALADEWNINDNRFCTYVNETEKVTLHVSYTHYKHGATYQVTDGLPGIRVVAASTEKVTLPSASILSSTEYENETYAKITAPKITQLKLAYSAGSFGNAYVITLSDGSLIVYDGGRGLGDDVGNMWSVLNALHKEAWGTEPTSNNPIHIRAWILSHEHGDHFTVFREFCKEYGKSSDLVLDALLFNPVSASERANSNNPESSIQTNMSSIQANVTGGFDFIKMHTGQTFYFANLKMEVLYTHEDTYPRGLEYFNNSSTIFRTTMKSVGKGETDTSTMIWLGDSERIGGNRLLALYGPTLDSDMVQIAHHGVNGVTYQCYQAIAPEIIWWPTSLSNFKSWSKKSNTSKRWYYNVDYQILHDLASVKMLLIADTYNTTMTFDGSGKEMETLHDLDGTEIVYSTYTKTDSWTGGSVIKKP
ncbi:MAG: hypothetical protein E7590_05545 [Ruminococcaceae bacterium]|nr:hypothetical protein [Oscillospiraceae bacterium]